jgi:hydroxypyruvate isomerase
MSEIHRRKLIKQLAAGGLVAASLPTIAATCSNTTSNVPKKTVLKNNINHSVCQWTYNFISLEELCKVVKDIGFGAIDLVGPKDWPLLQKYGLYSSMCYNGGKTTIPDGFNDKKNHEQLVKDYTDVIPLMVKAGYKNVICFSGNRKGMDDETGLKNCVEGLQRRTAFLFKWNYLTAR